MQDLPTAILLGLLAQSFSPDIARRLQSPETIERVSRRACPFCDQPLDMPEIAFGREESDRTSSVVLWVCPCCTLSFSFGLQISAAVLESFRNPTAN